MSTKYHPSSHLMHVKTTYLLVTLAQTIQKTTTTEVDSNHQVPKKNIQMETHEIKQNSRTRNTIVGTMSDQIFPMGRYLDSHDRRDDDARQRRPKGSGGWTRNARNENRNTVQRSTSPFGLSNTDHRCDAYICSTRLSEFVCFICMFH